MTNVTSNTNDFFFWPTDAPAPAIISESSSSLLESSSRHVSERVTKHATSSNPRKLLYPINNYDSTAELAPPQNEWVGLTPLDMVQTIVTLAKKLPGFSEALRARCSTTSTFLDRRTVRETGPIKKRKIECMEEYFSDTNGVNDGMVVEDLVESYSDLRINNHHDGVFKEWGDMIDSKNFPDLCGIFADFEHIVGADPRKAWCITSYNRVKHAFLSRVSATDADKDSFDLAEKRARRQMQVLVDLVHEQPKARDVTRLAVRGGLARRMDSSDGQGGPSLRRYLQNPWDRNDTFHRCMTLWMKTNFANPFPDETMLRTLANFLILELRCLVISKDDLTILGCKNPAEYHESMVKVTIERISNWLVNNRSRRWRPSIEQAFDGKRPASLLLEDSVAIFEGKETLRPIKNWDAETIFASDQLYSTRVRTWKKKTKNKGKRAKGKKYNSLNRTITCNRSASSEEKRPEKAPFVLENTPPFVVSNKTHPPNRSTSSEEKGPDMSPFVLGNETHQPIRSAHSEEKTFVLNNKTHPPTFEISPMCSQINRVMLSEGLEPTDFACV